MYANKSDRKLSLHNSLKKMNFGESIGSPETSTLECVPLDLMYFSALHYILMMNFMLFHGTLTRESWILL